MPRTRWAAHLLAAALLAGGWREAQPAVPPAAGPLEGTWVIASVQRDGEADPGQVGGTMTFTGGSVIAQPAAVRFADLYS